MGRPAKATPEAVADAVQKLITLGQRVTTKSVHGITDGSYATVSKLVREEMDKRNATNDQHVDLPEDLLKLSASLSTRMATEIYSHINKRTRARIEQIESDATLRITAAESECVDAVHKIEELENELSNTVAELDYEKECEANAVNRAKHAEGRATELANELERRMNELADAQLTTRLALSKAAELRGKIEILEKTIQDR